MQCGQDLEHGNDHWHQAWLRVVAAVADDVIDYPFVNRYHLSGFYLPQVVLSYFSIHSSSVSSHQTYPIGVAGFLLLLLRHPTVSSYCTRYRLSQVAPPVA